MGRPPAPVKASAGAGRLSEADLKVYEAIKKSGNSGIWRRDIKLATKMVDAQLSKSIKTLIQQKKIKEISNVNEHSKKMYILMELEPAKEVTGGPWYTGKNFDTEFIENLREFCLKFIAQQKVATLESIADFIRKSRMTTVEFQSNEIKQVVDSLVLDREVEEVTSTGTGIFAGMPMRKNCYVFRKKGAPEHAPFVSVPCGVCPVIHECTSDGIISPKTCVYFKKWLDF